MKKKETGRPRGASAVAQKAASSDPRSTLNFHELANLFPLLYDADYDELVADIKKHGLREPIWMYEDKVLDGRNRFRACRAAGVDPQFRHFSGTHAEAQAFVVSANIRRRHLNVEQRQHLLIELIASAPEKSDRQIGKGIGVDHKTIARARTKGEDVGRVPHVETRTDALGRQQPATKPYTPQPPWAKPSPPEESSPPPAAKRKRDRSISFDTIIDTIEEIITAAEAGDFDTDQLR